VPLRELCIRVRVGLRKDELIRPYTYLVWVPARRVWEFLINLFLDQAKSSSLGRTGVSLTSSSSRSWSSKDLLALAGPTAEATKPRIQIATERLHELFMALRVSEARENNEPYQPDAFLQALRLVYRVREIIVILFLSICHVHVSSTALTAER